MITMARKAHEGKSTLICPWHFHPYNPPLSISNNPGDRRLWIWIGDRIKGVNAANHLGITKSLDGPSTTIWMFPNKTHIGLL